MKSKKNYKKVDTIDLEGKHIILTPYRDRASQINQMGLDLVLEYQ